MASPTAVLKERCARNSDRGSRDHGGHLHRTTYLRGEPVIDQAAAPCAEPANSEAKPEPRPTRGRVLVKVVWTFVITVIAMIVFGGIVSLVTAVTLHEVGAATPAGTVHPLVIAVGVIVGSLVQVTLATGLAGSESTGRMQQLGLEKTRLPWLAYPATISASLLVGWCAMLTLRAIAGTAGRTLTMLREASQQASQTVWIVQLIGIAFIGPVAEEVFFRGFVQRDLRQAWGRWTSIGIASVMFALLHFDPVQSTYALCVGVFFGWVAEATGSIRPTILAHVSVNLISVLLGRFVQNNGDTQAFGSRIVFVALALAGLALANIWYLAAKFRALSGSARGSSEP